jgi:alcohol oxidase
MFRKLDSKTASFYYSRPSEWLGGRRAVVPCAHILGGGSSINFMVSECFIVKMLILLTC